MIAYDLQCTNGHTFEGWFEDESAYKDQKKKGLITCPACDDISVARIPSTFAVKSAHPSNYPGINLPEQNVDLEKIGKKIVDYVTNNFDDVGADFSTEALKIHYGASEPRNIRGVSTEEEEKTLKKEGIQFLKFPMPVRSDENTK